MPVQRPPDLDAQGQPTTGRPPDLDATGQPVATFSTTNEKDDQGNPLVRAASQFYEKSPLAAGVALVKGAANVVAHPLDTYFGLAPVAEAVKDAAKAHWNQAVIAAQKAKAAAGGDRLSAVEALGHGLAAVLPVLGPAAADVGEHGARGDVAGMVGGALGLLMPFAAKYGLELKNAPNPAKADRLAAEATQQVSQQVLAPGNPRYKPTAAKIAPDVLARGLTGDRLELQRLATEGKADALDRIEQAAQIDPKAPVPLAPVLKGIDDRIAAYQFNGKTVPGNEPYVAALKAQRDFIDSHGPTVAWEDLRELRQKLDRMAEQAKVYERAGDQTAGALGRAAADAAGETRHALGTTRPESVQPNADYTFFSRLEDVLDPTKGRPKQTNYVPTGVTGGMATVGALIGDGLSNVPGLRAVGALAGSQLLPRLKALFASPAWQLADASKKMALAEAIRKGDSATATTLITKISVLAPRGVPGWAAAAPIPAVDQTTPDTAPAR